MTMDAVDGNAIGGLLDEVFGADMTAAPCTCSSCGWTGAVAQLAVYRQAPGTVARCRSCTAVLMVFVRRRSMTCADLSGLASLG
jgi:Family of unknown function (DUF6510)